MKIGYARVSTQDQNLDMQTDALKSAGCEKVYMEHASGKSVARPELEKLMAHVRKGDTIVVWKLDRLGRSLKDLLQIINTFKDQGVGFVSLNDPIDTTTAQGMLVFNIFASLAEFEREIIRERTMAGLASARARGRKGGRPKGLSKEAQKTAMACETLYKSGELTIKEMCEQLGVSKSTFYSYLRARGVKIGK